MFNPSPKWTQEEKEEAIRFLCDLLIDDAKKGFIPPDKVTHIAETIGHLLNKDRSFLQNNRRQILKLIQQVQS